MARLRLLLLCVFVTACGSPPATMEQQAPPPAAPASLPPDLSPQAPSFTGKVWTTTDASAPLGTLRIFLPDGTLMMGSCVETYRLARWTAVASDRVEWREDTARIDATAIARGEQLTLRLHLVGGETKVETFTLARVPFVCPDLPR